MPQFHEKCSDYVIDANGFCLNIVLYSYHKMFAVLAASLGAMWIMTIQWRGVRWININVMKY